MKTLILTTVFILFSLTIFGQDIKALDDKYGFRGKKFEMLFDSLKNLVEVEKSFYKQTDEDLQIGDYKLNDVVYGFYKGQLYVVMIKTKGYSNSRGFLKILQEAYGKGEQDNEYIEKYTWNGRKVYLSYDQNSITDDAKIIMWSNKLMDIIKEDKKRSASEAAKKL